MAERVLNLKAQLYAHLSSIQSGVFLSQYSSIPFAKNVFLGLLHSLYPDFDRHQHLLDALAEQARRVIDWGREMGLGRPAAAPEPEEDPDRAQE